MKYYNFKKAQQLIAEATDLKTASLGMGEDWSWTAQSIWDDGEFTRPLYDGDVHSYYEAMKAELTQRLEGVVDGVERLVIRQEVTEKYGNANIGGIMGSGWATPRLHLEFKDGREEMYDCYSGESNRPAPEGFDMAFGEISAPCQERINAIPVVTEK